MDNVNTYKVNEEAVKKIAERVYDNGSTVINRNDLEEMFPELKESEDERIRGKIIATIHLYYGEPLEDEAKEMIAWLEKHGEQKPAFEMITPEESLGIDSDTYNKIVDDCVYGEQKPVDADLKDIVDKEANAIWKEINTGGSHSIVDSFNQFYGICMQVAEAVVDCKKPIEWIQELESKLSNATPEQLAEWKEKYFKVEPAWSKEDETVLDNLIYALANDRIGNDRDEYISWLKSLKDRIHPQPKQEWSEKDEVALDDALWCCKQAASIAKDDAENWLKSIKDKFVPQPKQEWKPSDEQMEALKQAKTDSCGKPYFNALASLYINLKGY